MKNHKENYETIIKKYYAVKFWIPILFIIILGYGFWLTNVSIGIDDPAGVLYFDQKVWLAQGRIGDEILSLFIDLSSFLPGWQHWITLTIMVMSSLSWTIFIDFEMNGTLSLPGAVVFNCLFLSFPYYSEIFVFDISALFTALASLLPGLACIGIYVYGIKQKNHICCLAFYV